MHLFEFSKMHTDNTPLIDSLNAHQSAPSREGNFLLNLRTKLSELLFRRHLLLQTAVPVQIQTFPQK